MATFTLVNQTVQSLHSIPEVKWHGLAMFLFILSVPLKRGGHIQSTWRKVSLDEPNSQSVPRNPLGEY